MMGIFHYVKVLIFLRQNYFSPLWPLGLGLERLFSFKMYNTFINIFFCFLVMYALLFLHLAV